VYFWFKNHLFFSPDMLSYLIEVFWITIFIPLVVLSFLLFLKKIDSVMIGNVSQRKIPLYLQIFLLGITTTITITFYPVSSLYFSFLASIISSILALILVYFNIKASLHMLGMASLLAFSIINSLYFFDDSLWIIVLIFLSTILVAISRWFMKAHTIQELIIGFFLGAVPQIITLNYWFEKSI